jgi:hypothetical protein
MKLDSDLMRKIALAIEAESSGIPRRNPKVAGYTDDQVGHHVYMMMTGGLVQGVDVTHQASTSRQAIATGLTMAGHKFAEDTRNDTMWKKVLEKLQQLGQTVTISLLVEVVTSLAKAGLGRP